MPDELRQNSRRLGGAQILYSDMQQQKLAVSPAPPEGTKPQMRDCASANLVMAESLRESGFEAFGLAPE
jgi:hypothetical protein